MPAIPVSKCKSKKEAPLTTVITDTYKANLALQLAQGGDCVFIGDSICSAGGGDDFTNAVQYQLNQKFVTKYGDPNYASGYGYFSVGDTTNGGTNLPTYWHEGGFSGLKFGENYYYPRMAISPNSASQCRFSFPPTLMGRKIRRAELVVTTFSLATTAPTITVDCYSTSAPLASGAAYITAGTASSITHSGLTGVTTVYTPGNVTNAPMTKLGLLPITFDGINHNPVIQVSVTQQVAILGIILYWDDHDIDGKGVRFHPCAAAGYTLFGSRYQAQNPNRDSGCNSWWRSFMQPDYCYGISNTSYTTSPTANAKLLIIEDGINTRLIWTTSIADYQAMMRDTTDLIMTTSDKVQILFLISYSPGGLCDPWRKGNDGTTGNIDPEGTWRSYVEVVYQLQGKYPDRIAILNLDADLGYKPYLDAITAKGWNTGDDVHWKNGGPGYAAERVNALLPAKGTFLKATGLNGGSITSSLYVALRMDSETLTNFGSAGGTWSKNAAGTLPSLKTRRTVSGTTLNFKGNSNYGYISSNNITPPTGDFSLFVRVKMTTDPGSGQVYISSLFGEESGVGGAFQVRLGDGLSNQIRVPSCSFADTRANAAIPLGSFATIGVRRSGSTITYFINGATAGTANTTTTATAMPFRLGEINGYGGRPLNGEMSHAFLWNRALSDTEFSTMNSNPDAPFSFV